MPLEDEIPVKFTFFRRAYLLPNTSPLTILRNVYTLQQDAVDPVPQKLVLTYFYGSLRGFNGRFQEQRSQFKPGYYKKMLT